MSTPKPPDGLELPTFFIDRDLGRIAFPAGLRAAGLTIVTIAERYGIQASEQVEDEAWMFEAAGHDWPVFCCDSKHRKRRRPAERAALLDSGLHAPGTVRLPGPSDRIEALRLGNGGHP